jgi:hypothetical protein
MTYELAHYPEYEEIMTADLSSDRVKGSTDSPMSTKVSMTW